ncbi:glycosyltransferase family 2 protein [Parafrigoribacterium humi]|uniref:glycosyltransferase family 2 protein n=1 Tax=Parafrigoribacterium humi TaxID=3144664 RepID=UPI0032EDC872
MTEHPSVSVVICAFTLRRWDDLVAAVTSARAQPDATEVLVVIDHEEELLARARKQWETTEVTVVSNRYRQGLSGGRNTGLELATSELAAFLDDDAVAADDWLRLLIECFDDDDVVGAGGAAVPVWPTGKPSATLPPELLWVVGCTYRGQPTERAEVRNVVGCSMLFRREPLLAIGGFNVATGRIGQIPLGGEETEACIKLRQLDPRNKVIFEPRSIVHHRVTPDRTTWRYLRRRCFFEGVSKSALSRDLGRQDALSSERSYAVRILPEAMFRELFHGRFASAYAVVLSLAAAGFGYLYGITRSRSHASVVSESEAART